MRKKITIERGYKVLACALSLLCALAVFPSCDASECPHPWGEYEYNETDHWRNYTCGHDTPNNSAPHEDGDGNGACDECGYGMKLPASVGLEYLPSEDGAKYAVKSIGACTDTEIVIPDTYEGLPVVAIYMEAFKGNSAIKSVVIPETVTAVYDYAFMECSALESVKFLGNSLKVIYYGAFLDCADLTEINLPDGLEVVYDYAFSGCASITELSIPSSVRRIERWAFANCTSLQSVVFPDAVTEIAESTCYGCTSLKSVDFGSGVTTVWQNAFYGCIALERLYIPKNITYLLSAFPACSSLNYIEFEVTSGWKWKSGAFFNSVDVTDPTKNAEKLKFPGAGDGSWKRETEE